MNISIKTAIFLIIISVLLSGCPRVAKLDFYNNTDVSVIIDIGGAHTEILSQTSKVLKFTSKNLMVTSSLGRWSYGRDLVPYGGEDGHYFDGTVYVQLNQDGYLYLIGHESARPLTMFPNQPEGFPLPPSS